MIVRRIAIASILATGALAVAGCGMMNSSKGAGGPMTVPNRDDGAGAVRDQSSGPGHGAGSPFG